MIYGLIICAGRQSRFKSETPKALMKIGDETILDRNIKAMSPFCDKVFVICSFQNEKYFDAEDKIIIESGKGSGDAVWQALERIKPKTEDLCFVQWGDSLQRPEIFKILNKNFSGVNLVPCVYEEKPYVQIKQVENGKLNVSFSKFNEEINPGFHDLSVFYLKALDLLDNLRKFRNKILDNNGNYVHKHGNEMEFLDVFNETDIKADVCECDSYQDFSFNTVEQFYDLLKRSGNI